MTCLYINLLRLWNERENEVTVYVVIVEEEGDSTQSELPLIGDVERDLGEFVVGEGLTHQQRGQLLDLLEEYKDRSAKILGSTDIVAHKITLKEGVPNVRRMHSVPGSL